MDSDHTSLKDRLLIAKYSRKECLAAMQGNGLPYALGDPVHRLCIIRGMRYHHGYGDELRGILPAFTRALNARSIMSNIIPTSFDSPDEIPYCIWYPDTATEKTYCELVDRYPHMAYQIGRACAVAGYTKLYLELPILPDVHIAEEARECGSIAIFEAIMSQPVRYSIMNDYTANIELDSREPANLNGDTCVRWMLDIKQELRDADTAYYERDGKLRPKRPALHDFGYDNRMFNLTEDMHIDDRDSDEIIRRHSLDREEVRLLSEPLPLDLTTVQKDLLIAMAAYHGNVDRYARLRRPQSVSGELDCCVRGIYHSTPFAVWWSKQPGSRRDAAIEKAINARFVMNNVLSGAPFRCIPFLIWWPTKAKPATYRHLAKLQPEMLPQIMHACISAGYSDLFEELLPHVNPDKALIRAAELSSSKYYLEALQSHIERSGNRPQDPPGGEYWRNHMSDETNYGRSSDHVMKYLESGAPANGFQTPYDGRQCDASQVDLMICLPEGWRLSADDEQGWRTLDYEEWPPSAVQ